MTTSITDVQTTLSIDHYFKLDRKIMYIIFEFPCISLICMKDSE